jgi:hypothetical protein
MVAAWACRNRRQVVSVRRFGAGGIRRAFRIRRIVEAPTRWPSLRSSPWIRWYPQLLFSVASRSMSAVISALTGGRPAVRVGPLLFDQKTVPAKDGAGRDQPVCPQRPGQLPDQGGQHRSVSPVQPGPGPGAAEHSDLVPQHQQFRVLRRRRAAAQDEPAAEPDQDQVEQAKGHG